MDRGSDAFRRRTPAGRDSDGSTSVDRLGAIRSATAGASARCLGREAWTAPRHRAALCEESDVLEINLRLPSSWSSVWWAAGHGGPAGGNGGPGRGRNLPRTSPRWVVPMRPSNTRQALPFGQRGIDSDNGSERGSRPTSCMSVTLSEWTRRQRGCPSAPPGLREPRLGDIPPVRLEWDVVLQQRPRLGSAIASPNGALVLGQGDCNRAAR